RIYPGNNWNARTRSPLTEAGANVREGELILAVDGVDARTVKNFYQLMQDKGDRHVVLRVGSRADGSGAREVRVKALSSELDLRYGDWVAGKRALVDRLSNGRIGYIHVPNTS